MFEFAADMNRPMFALNAAFSLGTSEMFRNITATRKEFLMKWLSDYAEHISLKELLLSKESVNQSNETIKQVHIYSRAYASDLLNYEKTESDKTNITQKENENRERIFQDSMRQKQSVLREFVSIFSDIGVEYGEALINGIQGTSERIRSYLNSVADSVRAASSGASVSGFSGFSAPVGFGISDISGFSADNSDYSFKDDLVSASWRYEDEQIAMVRAVQSFSDISPRASGASFGAAAGHAPQNAEVYGAFKSGSGGVVYSPTYISPVESSIDELMVKDQIMMRRLGLSF
jgi:hypothetical protein